MARSFTNVGDYVASSTFGGLSGTAGTVSVWIKPNWNSGDSALHEFWIFGSATAPSDTPSFQKYLDNNIYCGFVNGTDYRVVVSDSGLFTSGVWANWVFTYTNSSGSTLYKNGISVGTHAGLSTNPASQFLIGVNQTSVPVSVNSSLADLTVWDVALTAGQVAALSAGLRPHLLGKQPTLFLPLDGLVSPEPDLSGNANNGAVTGTARDTGPPLALFTPRRPALFAAAASGLSLTSNATIGPFTQSATLKALEKITSAKTINAFTQVATLTKAGTPQITSAATIGAFTQSATLKALEKITSSATITPFTQVATLTESATPKITSAATIRPFTQTATLNAVEKITSSVTFGNFTQAAVILGTAAALQGGAVRKRHSKRYEITLNGITFIAPSIAALETKVAAWRLAHPANDAKTPAPLPRPVQTPPHAAVPPAAAAPAIATEQSGAGAHLPPITITAGPVPAASPETSPASLSPTALSPAYQPPLVSGDMRGPAELAQAQEQAILEAFAAEVARRQAEEDDDLAAIRAILALVA